MKPHSVHRHNIRIGLLFGMILVIIFCGVAYWNIRDEYTPDMSPYPGSPEHEAQLRQRYQDTHGIE